MKKQFEQNFASPPRPDFKHEHWMSLDGWWEFAPHPFEPGSARDAGDWWDSPPNSPTSWGRIRVPYPWPSPASGVRDPGIERAWYKRTVELPDSWKGKTVTLWFGAVIDSARVWVNGQLLGTHKGSYEPFSFLLPSTLTTAGGLELIVGVYAPLDRRHLLHGKQRNCPPAFPYDDCAFTPCGGIWQPVWLEASGWARLDRCQFHWSEETRRLTTTVFGRAVRLGNNLPAADTAGDTADLSVAMTIRQDEASLSTVVSACQFHEPDPVSGMQAFTATLEVELPAESVHLWEPEDPYLYSIDFLLKDGQGVVLDSLHSYHGLRTVRITGQEILLNGKPLIVKGALDQGFWPHTLYAVPNDEAIRRDLVLAKSAGFNLIRKHLKLEDPRFLYWADRLGVLVWEELPSASSFYPTLATDIRSAINTMVERDGNHPSIVIWGIFNEEWGLNDPHIRSANSQAVHSERDKQEIIREMYTYLKSLDATRPVVDNSGWNHVVTDIADYHLYQGNPTRFTEAHRRLCRGDPVPLYDGRRTLFVPASSYSGQPIICSEFVVGSDPEERAWQFLWQVNAIRLTGSSGYVATELYDIEHELAGVYHYDRTEKPGLDLVREANQKYFLAVGIVPHKPGIDLQVIAGQTLRLPVICNLAEFQCAPAQMVSSSDASLSLAWRWSRSDGRYYSPDKYVSVSVIKGRHLVHQLNIECPLQPGQYLLQLSLSAGTEPLSYRHIHVFVRK